MKQPGLLNAFSFFAIHLIQHCYYLLIEVVSSAGPEVMNPVWHAILQEKMESVYR